ncbi:hypothetical protein [Bacillus sp. JJ1609]
MKKKHLCGTHRWKIIQLI